MVTAAQSAQAFLASGSPYLASGRRKILNLWTETDACHLGHWHMLKVAGELAQANDVTFYVGEFPSDFWKARDYHRLEDQYAVTCELLKRLVPAAKAEYGQRFNHSDILIGKKEYARILIDARKEPSALDPRMRDLFRRIYKRPWGGENSPFVPIFSLYAVAGHYDALLIAKRHEYIGETLAEFTRHWKKHPIELLVVKDFPGLCAPEAMPMTQQERPVRMQEPIEYLQHRLKTNESDPNAEAFIEASVRCFIQRPLDEKAFGDYWKAEKHLMLDRANNYSKFCDSIDALFEEYRDIIYSVLPHTRAETHHRITNAYLIRYMGMALGSWSGNPPPPWAEDVDPNVNTQSHSFERTLYQPAFEGIAAELAERSKTGSDRGLSVGFVAELLRLTENNRTTDLLLFFGSKKMHRDHYVHTFNVGALGQFLLDLHLGSEQLKAHIATALDCTPELVEAVWWLTAMLHDHAYPLYSFMQWMERLGPLAQAYPNEVGVLQSLARAHLDQLTFVHGDVLAPLREAVDGGEFGLQRLADSLTKKSGLFWFLDPDDAKLLSASPPVDHAFAAVLNLACYVSGMTNIRAHRLPAEILRAILFHTQIRMASGEVQRIHWKKDPFAYLLLVCDEIQEWSRRVLTDKGMDITDAELLLSPLHRRYEGSERWQVPSGRPLEITVRYAAEQDELAKWTSHHFQVEKEKMFGRLQADADDPIPPIRLYYSVASKAFPAKRT